MLRKSIVYLLDVEMFKQIYSFFLNIVMILFDYLQQQTVFGSSFSEHGRVATIMREVGKKMATIRREPYVSYASYFNILKNILIQ